MWSTSFWAAAAERAVKTAAQVTIAFLGADAINAFNVDYQRVAGIALGAAVVSVLTSLASAQAGPVKGTPSLVGEGGR
jgi:ABC-type enterochelin transport system permease subunit